MTSTQNQTPQLVLSVPLPATPDDEVVIGFRVQVASGSYPTGWDFSEGDLDDAVERWADEGLDRCNLTALSVRPCDGEFDPAELTSLFTRTGGWSAWRYT